MELLNKKIKYKIAMKLGNYYADIFFINNEDLNL